LGSVDDGDTERMCVRVDFWDRVLVKLDTLNLATEDRSRIEKAITSVVSRPSDDEASSFWKEREEYIAASVELFKRFRLLRLLGRK